MGIKGAYFYSSSKLNDELTVCILMSKWCVNDIWDDTGLFFTSTMYLANESLFLPIVFLIDTRKSYCIKIVEYVHENFLPAFNPFIMFSLISFDNNLICAISTAPLYMFIRKISLNLKHRDSIARPTHSNARAIPVVIHCMIEWKIY